MAGIYLHIPFCRQACHYCDFHFSTNTSIKTDLIGAMVKEIVLRHEYLENKPVQTIYFGGGTPSMLAASEVHILLDSIHTTHVVSTDAEVTLEANPDDLTADRLAELKALGINRLSIGIQSFDDGILKYLNRLHDAQSAIRSVERARATGFNNISVDLIYAIPGLTHAAWKKNIAQAVALHPQHISAYSLTVEEKTTFGKWLSAGKLKTFDESMAAEQLEILMADLRQAGYNQYEISNFALPSFESVHNSSYWKGDAYLGIGPSAHSYNTATRQHNVSNNYEYVRSLNQDKTPCEMEVLKIQDHVNEYILTNLRTSWGCSIKKLKDDFGFDILDEHGAYIRTLESHRLIIIQNNQMILTDRGRLVADKISSDLFLLHEQ